MSSVTTGFGPQWLVRATTEALGDVITFYSYKGGTGRSMALVNCAGLLARALPETAKPILLVDFDLEAPGLHRYLAPFLNDDDVSRGRRGVLELFAGLEHVVDQTLNGAERLSDDLVAELVDSFDLAPFIALTGVPALRVITAGSFDDTYSTRLTRFDWEGLQRKAPALFRCLSERWSREFAFTFVDSRTGLSDTSSICTSLLPDVLVVVFTPNRQSLTGVDHLVRMATDYRSTASDSRALRVYPLASRVDNQVEHFRQLWRYGAEDALFGSVVGYEPLFRSVLSSMLGMKDPDDAARLTEYFDVVQVPHTADYSYGERLCFASTSASDSLSVRGAYEQLLPWIATGCHPWQRPSEVLLDQEAAAWLRGCGADAPPADGNWFAWFQRLSQAIGASEPLHPSSPIGRWTGSKDRGVDVCLAAALGLAHKGDLGASARLLATAAQAYHEDIDVLLPDAAPAALLGVWMDRLATEEISSPDRRAWLNALESLLRRWQGLKMQRSAWLAACVAFAQRAVWHDEIRRLSKELEESSPERFDARTTTPRDDRPRKVLICSTSQDLVEHRRRLMQVFRRMQADIAGMESFDQEPGTPVESCLRRVDEADLIVMVLGHRYGWVPAVEEGGDGLSSITQLEFKRARAIGKAILAFTVDEKAEWASPREQDALVNARSREDALRIFNAVSQLQAFKREIEASVIRDIFSTPADLADKAATAVANWLFLQKGALPSRGSAVNALELLFGKVSSYLRDGFHELALAYLDDAAKTADPAHFPPIADKRLGIAFANLSICDPRLTAAAKDVIEMGGERQAQANLALGRCESQQARSLWNNGERERAWVLAQEARAHLEVSAKADPINPDTFGSLGWLLKRMALWAPEIRPDQTIALEDATISAYRTGWEIVPDSYPLLNFLEQRAWLAERRMPASGGRPLIEKDESHLRVALGMALKTREAQLGNRQDRPWAAFDVARGRHYLNPNVAGFLEDLEIAVEEARSVARDPLDRYMIATTIDSLQTLQRAKVQLEGLSEGIALLARAIENDDWYLDRPKRAPRYLELELLNLQTALVESMDRKTIQNKEVAQFIRATELCWSREDEDRFQAEIARWKRAFELTDLKILRGLWKVFGAKSLDAVAGGVPVDWDNAAKLVGELALQ